jgi:hypothetical protein
MGKVEERKSYEGGRIGETSSKTKRRKELKRIIVLLAMGSEAHESNAIQPATRNQPTAIARR